MLSQFVLVNLFFLQEEGSFPSGLAALFSFATINNMNALCIVLQSRSLFPADFRWTDPHTWPWMIWVWVAFILLGWIAPLWRWFQRDRANSWPSAIGSIESIGKPEPRKFLGLVLSRNSSEEVLEL